MRGATVVRAGLISALLGAAVTAGSPAFAAPKPPRAPKPGILTVQTVPPAPGERVSAEGNIVTADSHGVARLPVTNWLKINDRFHVLDTRIGPSTRVALDRTVGKPSSGQGGRAIQVGLKTLRLISFDFSDRGGQGVSLSRISMLEMRSNTGEIMRLTQAELAHPFWVSAGRTQLTPTGLVNKDIYWRISRVVVDGAEAVNSSQQVFYPQKSQHWTVALLFYTITLSGTDLLFGTHAGDGVELKQPDGVVRKQPFDSHGEVTFTALPRGTYTLTVYGAGATFARPLSISKDQALDVEVISNLDIYVVIGVAVLLMVSLVAVGRRHYLNGLARAARTRTSSSRRVVETSTLVALLVASFLVVQRPQAAYASNLGVPAYAYYYIWYQPTSWLRAKSDAPLLGRYSSDDAVVMQDQITMAKAAGLDGFIVSWKSTAQLDPRLDTLVRLSTQAGFELAVVYEGLTHDRHPLPVKQIISDLTWLAQRYGATPPFHRFGMPVVALTGSDQYSLAELSQIRAAVQGKVKLLATAKDVTEYDRLASVVDGNAYYWSSARAAPGWYTDKLVQMADAVHRDHGLWFAPAAAGFDARLIGGTQVIDRGGGAQLRAAVTAAMTSHPDVLSVISWNEFSENSFVEPSVNQGIAPLEAVASILGGRAELPRGLTPPTTAHARHGLTGWGALVGLALILSIINLVGVRLHSGRRTRAPAAKQSDDAFDHV